MRSESGFGAVLLLLLLMATVSVPAGAVGAEPIDEVLPLRIELIDHSNHPEVLITVSVPRELVGKDIPEDQFAVLDGRTQVIPEVTRLSSDDLEVVLVLDTSGSMAGAAIEEAKSAAKAFTAQLPTGVRIAVVGFGSEPRTATSFTTDLAVADAAIDRLSARGETALYDAVAAAADLFENEARRAVVVLSDGGDTVSGSTLEEAIIGLLAAKADFYAVGLDTSETDDAALSRMSIASGGALVAAEDPAALAGIFDEIASGLVNRYLLRYTSESFEATEIVVGVAADGILAQGSERVNYPAPPAVAVTPGPPVTAPAVLDPIAPPTPIIAQAPGLLGNKAALFSGLGAIFLGSIIILSLLLTSDHRVRLSRKDKALSSESDASGVTKRAILFAEDKLQKGGRRSGLGILLERAGSRLRVGEFVLMAFSAALIAFSAGYFLGGWLPAVGLGALVAGGSRLPLQMRANRRQKAFADQLSDNLQLVAGSVRAGYGLVQAIDTVAGEALPPTSEEFHRIVAEINLGRDAGEALRAAAERTQSDDFTWVVEAMDVHRQVGGDLSELLDSVAATIRERTQLRRKVDALSAEGRLSAIVLLSLPFGLAGFISVANPGFMDELFMTGIGQTLIAVGLTLMAIGVVWMRKIIDLDY